MNPRGRGDLQFKHGIGEEAGFRGFMQGPLERRYGPAVGIAITSMVFGLAHLTHGAFLPAILFDIGWGALYGSLTYRSGSIVPAIVLHSSADALEFIAAWKFPPAAGAPLAWASGSLFLMIQAALGIEFDPAAKAIRFRNPRLPPSFDQIVLRQLRLNDARVDIELKRSGSHVSMRVLRNIGAIQVSMVVD